MKKIINILAVLFFVIQWLSVSEALEFGQFQELFNKNARYTGMNQCRRCHDDIVKSFSQSRHSKAFISLASRGKDDDGKCIPCHVTGYGRADGYKNLEETPEMSGVQCESCHGPGSLHTEKIDAGEFSLSLCNACHPLGKVEGMAAECDRCHPDFRRHLEKVRRKDLIVKNPSEKTCTACHDAENDPDFDLKSLYSAVGHGRVTGDFSGIESSAEEKGNIVFLESRPEVKSGASYAGNDSCKGCHPEAYKKWLSTKHSKSFETLESDKEEKTSRCLRCHSTGYGRKSGFIDSESTPDLKEVGCETCHGPGKDHVKAPKNKKMETVYGITSECPTCGLSVTCKRCHNMRQDPDFDTAKGVEVIRCGKIN